MQRDEAARRLPPSYQQVLAMLDAGTSQSAIARALGIEPGAVGPLIELAEAKLERIRADTRHNRKEQP